MLERYHLSVAKDLIGGRLATDEVQRHLIMSWFENPHSAMKCLESAALVYPLMFAGKLVDTVVTTWKVLPNYSWQAGEDADHCYLAALCLTGNVNLAEQDLLAKCTQTVLKLYMDKSQLSPLIDMCDKDSKMKLLIDALMPPLSLGPVLASSPKPGIPKKGTENDNYPLELRSYIEELEEWSKANKKEATQDALAFWSLKLPAIIVAATTGL